MSPSLSHVPTSPRNATAPIALVCTQGFLGLVLGAATAMVLFAADPLSVTSFRIPQGADGAQVMFDFVRWKSSIRVVIGELTMTWIPFLVSGACGIWTHKFHPASIPSALRRMIGVASLFAMVSWFGSGAIDRAPSTGESSDILTPLAMLAFGALCISLAAPLSSSVIRRRSPCQGGQAPQRG